MAEYTQALAVAVAPGANVPFGETAVRGGGCIQHREGSGIVTLRGATSQCKALYQVDYSGNIALPTGGTPGEISLAIAVEGEPLLASQGRVVPAAAGDFFNIAVHAQIAVPRGCCVTVGIRNTSGVPIDVANSNLIVTRIA